MPKGRHLKPDFFTDKNVVAMTPLARLLYQGLWCYAADCGHLDDEPVELKMRILPADNCDVDALLDEIAWHKRITRKDGVIEVPNLTEHQKPDKRYMTLCDACKADDVDPDERKRWGLHKRWHIDREITKEGCEFCTPRSEPVVSTTGIQPPSPLAASSQVTSAHVVSTTGPRSDHVVDGDGDGDGDVMVKGAAKSRSRSTTIPKDWTPSDAHRAIATEERVDLASEARKFRDSNEAKGRTYVDWDAAFRNWLRSPYAAKVGPAPAVTDPSQLPPVEESWMRRRR